MNIFRITILVVVLAMLGSTFSVEAKVKKRRSTAKKEKVMKKTKKVTKTQQPQQPQDQQCGLDMVEYCSQGMRMSPVAQMRVERKDGKVVFAIKGTTTDEKEYVIDDGEQILKEALEIIEQEKMLEYQSSYSRKTSGRILDGEKWSFEAKLADGRSLSTHGSNAYPDGKGLNRMSKLLYERAYKLLEDNPQQKK